MNLLLATASNKQARKCRDLCAQSMRRYCLLYPEIKYAVRDLPDNGEKAIYWYKIPVFRELLPLADYLLWIDPDALIVGRNDFRELIQPCTLNIAVDINGINGGVTAIKNCPKGYAVLDRIESLFDEFRDHCWGPQTALASFIDEIDVFYQPKHIWNAYPEPVKAVHDDTPESMVLHWPGMKPDEAAKYMRLAVEHGVEHS